MTKTDFTFFEESSLPELFCAFGGVIWSWLCATSVPNWGAIGTPESVESLGRQYRHVELGRMVQTSDAGYLFSHLIVAT